MFPLEKTGVGGPSNSGLPAGSTSASSFFFFPFLLTFPAIGSAWDGSMSLFCEFVAMIEIVRGWGGRIPPARFWGRVAPRRCSKPGGVSQPLKLGLWRPYASGERPSGFLQDLRDVGGYPVPPRPGARHSPSHPQLIHSSSTAPPQLRLQARGCIGEDFSRTEKVGAGLPSEDRNNKATLPLTGPGQTNKSYAKVLSPRIVKLQYTS